jgi:hypothetical protein
LANYREALDLKLQAQTLRNTFFLPADGSPAARRSDQKAKTKKKKQRMEKERKEFQRCRPEEDPSLPGAELQVYVDRTCSEVEHGSAIPPPEALDSLFII